MSLDTSKTVKKITYNGVEFVQAGSSNLANDLINGTITEVTDETLGGVESIRNNAFNGMDIETVSVPSNVAVIGDGAFSNNTITTLTINEGVQTIGNNAFQNNNIETVTIPSTVTSIGEGAFAGNNLTEITMESDIPPIVTSTTFPSTLESTNVSYAGYDNYANDPNWTTYKNTLVRGLAIPSTITVTVDNYLGELVSGANVTIEGNGQTYNGVTDDMGVYVQNDLQPATYTITLDGLDGFKTPSPLEVVVEQDTQNSVTVTYLEKTGDELSRVFGENSPAVISTVADDIATKGYTSSQVEEVYGWKIGDTTSYTLSTGETVEMRIIGFNHDDLSSGMGKAGITLEMTNSLATKYKLNNEATNAGGYPASLVKTTHMPAIKATLPQEWQDIIVMVDKKSANGGSTNYTATVTTSEDLFLLSVIEISGTTVAQDGANEGSIYEYWNGKTGAALLKKLGGVGADYTWWTRSCRADSDKHFHEISYRGEVDSDWPIGEYGVSYAFCVGEPQPSRTFSDNSPAMVSAISKQISANNMTSAQVAETYGWNIGDTISYQLTTGENVEMRIIGFNHDDKSDGSGKAGITLEMTHLLKAFYKINENGVNGYVGKPIKTSVLPSILKTLPQEWQDVIVTVNKNSAAGGKSDIVDTSENTLFLLSEIEMFGTTTAQNGVDEGVVYEYWNGKTDADRIKYRDSDSDGVVDSAIVYFLRSSIANNTALQCVVNKYGAISNTSAKNGSGLSYAFCI